MKKKTVTIKRETVIEALKTEPLRSSRFFHNDENLNHMECQVCAVGAVLRKHLRINEKLLSIVSVGSDVCKGEFTEGDGIPKKIAKSKNYLGALSVYFEKLLGEPYINPNKRQIGYLVRFVKENFPKQFKLTYKVY